MLIILCIFLIIAVIEVILLLRKKETAEAVIYMIISALTASLALFLLLSPGHENLAEILINFLNIKT